MRLLVLGGTRFFGRRLVEMALARGHEVTLFNRGRSGPGLFPEVERIVGDRDGGLGALDGRRWEAAIDTCGYLPRLVSASARALAGSVDHYTFISSLSVYADIATPGAEEGWALAALDDETTEEIADQTLGPLKALCERAAEAVFPGRALLIRSGLIFGPHDTTDRFTYWVQRIARGGTVLVPGRPEQPVQFVDVGDLAAWTLRLVEARQAGAYNATGPAEPLPFGQLLAACREASGGAAEFVWVDERFLDEQGVEYWSELPLWAPAEGHSGLFAVDCRKARATGLTFRAPLETARETLAWARTVSPGYRLKTGLAPEREAQLLQLWQSRAAGVPGR